MTVEDAKKLIDLFIDDELPMELASEFKQVMFENPGLRDEVSSLRATKDTLGEAYAADRMSEAERTRVFSRIIAGMAIQPVESISAAQLKLPHLRESRIHSA